MFDHSTITHFINRIGRQGFSQVFAGLNEELLRMGLLSPELYVDSSMVKANVNNFGLSRSGMTVEEFKEQAIETNGLFMLPGPTVDADGAEHDEVRYFQDPQGRLPLSPVDTDARWCSSKPGKLWGFHYEENAVVDGGGFILSRSVTHASQGEWKALPALLEKLPIRPVSLAADTACSVGELRQLLEEKDIRAYIPIHPNQEGSMVSKGDFIYRGDHLICPQGKELRRSALQRRERAYQYVAHQKDCQACPAKAQCLPANQKRRYVALSMYHPCCSGPPAPLKAKAVAIGLPTSAKDDGTPPYPSQRQSFAAADPSVVGTFTGFLIFITPSTLTYSTSPCRRP